MASQSTGEMLRRPAFLASLDRPSVEIERKLVPALLVTRNAHDEAGLLRRIKVKVDGKVVAKLRPQQQVELDLAVGEHVILAQMDWFTGGPVTLNFQENDFVRLKVSLSFVKSWRGFIEPKRGIIVERIDSDAIRWSPR